MTRSTQMSASAIRGPALSSSEWTQHLRCPELYLHVQEHITFCTRRIAKSASPSRDFASTVVSELRKHTPEKGSADTCIPSASAATALRRSARKVENHNLYSAMWQHLCAAAWQERKRAQASSECRGCTSLSSLSSQGRGCSPRTSPSTT